MTSAEPDPLVAAIGGALDIIAALMERAQVASVEEFASALGVYGKVTGETNPEAGAIIAQWTSTLHQLAASRHEKN
ncbi:hypothetical protein [Sphingobium sp. AP50]|uniref:hypothetical protein n=1 Tax=Sphingobium sp. AP50 TaxID=1884369 RepID=UPI000B89B103|nr:hypothetical protein [Sphingobium sp. AP50]